MTSPRDQAVLLSAYACEPDKGSEPGVGWNWATEIARLGYEVWVITRVNNRPAIDNELAVNPLPSLHIVYYDLPAWSARWKKGNRGIHLYYYIWQFGAAIVAWQLSQRVRFSLVHHITFGVFRHPSWMAFLRVPFVFGPLGGGERAPGPLRRSFSLKGVLKDFIRDVANIAARLDPFWWTTLERSTLILCKTQETLRCIPVRYHSKCRVLLEIGVANDHPLTLPTPHGQHAFKVLYVGRLIYWKGMHLGLRAFAALCRNVPHARLTVIGGGPELGPLQRLAQELGIEAQVEWIAWLPRAEVLAHYRDYDAFMFPSLHDSSGNVVLEALSEGLPVICFDLGGPSVIVDASCGFIVPTAGKNESEAVHGVAAALEILASNPERRKALSRGALAKADGLRWERVVASVYGCDAPPCLKG